MRVPIPVKTVLAALVALGLFASSAAAQVEEDLNEADKLFDSGDLEKAAKRYDNAIRRYPGQVAAAAYGKRAAIFLIRKDYQGCLKFVSSVAEPQHPDSPEVLEQKALCLWALGSKPDAVAVAEQVVKKKPTTFTNQKIIGEYYAAREPEKAASAFEAYLSNRPSELEKGDVLPRIRLGFSYLLLGQRLDQDNLEKAQALYNRAEEQFELVLKKHRSRQHAEVNAENGLCAAYTVQEKFDRAVTLCERIIQDPRKIDRNGSVWFNLGTAYLFKKQPQRARTAGNEYIRMRRSEPKGYVLVGDAYYAERDWARALEMYLRAEQLAKREDAVVKLANKLGQTYRRLGQLDKAIAKLETAVKRNPANLGLAVELGGAYLETQKDEKAQETVERWIQSERFAATSDKQKSGLLLIAARAAYNRGQVAEARQRYETAYGIRKRDVLVRNGLVQTINMEAFEQYRKGDMKAAGEQLQAALAVSPKDTRTNQNLAIMSIEEGNCDRARDYLQALKNSRANSLVYHRLMGRTYLCGQKVDQNLASRHFAAAEKQAADANLMRAEIYIEWAPLLMRTNIEDAVDKLQTAVQFAARTPGVGEAAKRNLALALFRRGWGYMREGKSSQAEADFERAVREPQLLRGTEPLAFEFSYALAQLENGKTSEAAKIFGQLASKGAASAYLKDPYDKVGNEFFEAYAKYRSGNVALRRQAATDFERLQRVAKGKFAGSIRDLAASAWEYVAFDAYSSGNGRGATDALQGAARSGSGRVSRSISHNQAVLQMSEKSSSSLLSRFQSMGDNPPEALVNAGIMYDRAGQPKQAYDAWVQARSKGVKSRDLQKWIAAKQRIFGY